MFLFCKTKISDQTSKKWEFCNSKSSGWVGVASNDAYLEDHEWLGNKLNNLNPDRLLQIWK